LIGVFAGKGKEKVKEMKKRKRRKGRGQNGRARKCGREVNVTVSCLGIARCKASSA